MSSNYDSIRAAVDASGADERVEVNQRALIDKILARYASVGAVYRELLQNSNDAEASQAQVLFTVDENQMVSQVVYRNNGVPFRPQDWSRLRKIAEGNPNPEKVGAFGVGAYTMFSIAEEPLVLSGGSALKFVWKGDALWTKTTELPPEHKQSEWADWTTFVLPSRDLYPVPDWVTFGQFLAASLTFTKCLDTVSVFANGSPILHIKKRLVQTPRLVTVPQLTEALSTVALPKWTSWFKAGGTETIIKASPKNLFQIEIQKQEQQPSIYESIYEIAVTVHHEIKDLATIQARLITATASTKIPKDMVQRMTRVTKKDPPNTVTLQIYLDTTTDEHQINISQKRNKKLSKAQLIAQSFRPVGAAGRIFIGFRTSQTTGVSAHVAAPFLPTVEREAMDLQDPTLRIYNMELLYLAGIVLRFTLQHAFACLAQEWVANAAQRRALLMEGNKPLIEAEEDTKDGEVTESQENSDDDDATSTNTSAGGFMGFARFMARGVQKKIQSVVTTVMDEVGKTASVAGVVVGGGIDYNSLVSAAPDGRPLCREEYLAIVLMQSLCPSPSTPDPLVGTCLAQGFSECMPNTPAPCLTNQGVVPANQARLPAHGMEAFCRIAEDDGKEENLPEQKEQEDVRVAPPPIVRHVIWQQTQEYHAVIASQCRPLEMELDLFPYLKATVLTQSLAIRLIQWWKPYSRILGQKMLTESMHRPHYNSDYGSSSNVSQLLRAKGVALKEAIRFTLDSPDDKSNNEVTVLSLKDYLFYLDKDSPLTRQLQSQKDVVLPLPETVLPVKVQELIGDTTMNDAAFANSWFQPVPMELWIEFMAHHSILTQARAQDSPHRLAVLTLLHQEYKRRGIGRHKFGEFLKSLLEGVKCIPYDSPRSASKQSGAQMTSNNVALVDVPSALYLYSAELKAFEGVAGGSFFKVSKQVQDAGVTEDFLLALGVRKSVSIDFLFENLDSLQWNSDPRPLVEYLKSATLTPEDLAKLSHTKYLPAETSQKDKNNATEKLQQQNFAPSELYLPTEELRIFPFVKLLNWPTETEISERSENGRFLVKLGMRIMPSLVQVLQYVSMLDLTPVQRTKALDFLANHLSPSSAYHAEYFRMPAATLKRYQFLPCTTIAPLSETSPSSGENLQLASPPNCFSDPQCAVMGFPVLDDSKLTGTRRDFYASVFQCPQQPEPTALVHQLLNLVSMAKRLQVQKADNAGGDLSVSFNRVIMSVLAATFKYLSHRSSDFSPTLLGSLRSESFIPCIIAETNKVEWFRVDQVFFKQPDRSGSTRDSLTEELFQVVEFSPFLAAAGVKQDATSKELFQRLLEDPKAVFQALGKSEKKYRALLRRIASDPPFNKVTDAVRNCPFLLAYTLSYRSDESSNKGAVDSATYDLAAAKDVFIIDNSFFGRMFPVKRAPPETDLEEFYALIGCEYISKSVERRFEVVGKPMPNTPLTMALLQRVVERAPLLVSPHVTTRPLVSNSTSILDHLEFFEASNLLAVYSFRGITRRSKTTCFSRKSGGGLGAQNYSIFVVDDFDWFDVGYAIGDLILKRCQLEDAFFISSLLDAPLEQLRARGFPVDRVLQATPVALPQSPPPAPAARQGSVARAVNQPDGKPVIWNPNGTIASDIPALEQNEQTIVPAAEPPKAQQTSKVTGGTGAAPTSDGGFEQILSQMFPDADPEFIKAALGSSAKLEDVRQLAESMAAGNYPKKGLSKNAAPAPSPPPSLSEQDDQTIQTESSFESSSNKKKREGIRKKLGRALGYMGGSSNSLAGENNIPNQPPPANPLQGAMGGMAGIAGGGFSGGGGGVKGPPVTARQESTTPVMPAEDVNSHKNLERMLEQAVGSSTSVNQQGIESSATMLTSVPEGLDRGETCEIIDGQSLKPWPGPKGNGKTRNGIRLFSSNREPSSQLLLQNVEVVESFAFVLENLAKKVFGLRMESIAIFNEPGGRSIAFNSNRSLHFNLRFYFALHFISGKRFSREAYSYWYVTIAHELSHNLVSGHNKEHGFYTESFATYYLPKLVDLLASI